MPMGAIQVKNVPDELHERVRARARDSGLTLGQYVLDLIRRDLRRPSRDEWFSAVDEADLGPLPGLDDAAGLVRQGRRERERRGSDGD